MLFLFFFTRIKINDFLVYIRHFDAHPFKCLGVLLYTQVHVLDTYVCENLFITFLQHFLQPPILFKELESIETAVSQPPATYDAHNFEVKHLKIIEFNFASSYWVLEVNVCTSLCHSSHSHPALLSMKRPCLFSFSSGCSSFSISQCFICKHSFCLGLDHEETCQNTKQRIVIRQVSQKHYDDKVENIEYSSDVLR
jgi:hypothetical protein